MESGMALQEGPQARRGTRHRLFDDTVSKMDVEPDSAFHDESLPAPFEDGNPSPHCAT